MSHRPTITLVGRACHITFCDGTAQWQINVRRRQHPTVVDTFNLRAIHTSVIEQFEQMDEDQLIGVIAEVPPKLQLVAGVPLTVTRLELLGKPVATVEG